MPLPNVPLPHVLGADYDSVFPVSNFSPWFLSFVGLTPLCPGSLHASRVFRGLSGITFRPLYPSLSPPPRHHLREFRSLSLLVALCHLLTHLLPPKAP